MHPELNAYLTSFSVANSVLFLPYKFWHSFTLSIKSFSKTLHFFLSLIIRPLMINRFRRILTVKMRFVVVSCTTLNVQITSASHNVSSKLPPRTDTRTHSRTHSTTCARAQITLSHNQHNGQNTSIGPVILISFVYATSPTVHTQCVLVYDARFQKQFKIDKAISI